MSVDLNRAAMLESNSPRFESLIAQTAAQELWTWTPGPVAGLRCLNSQDSRQCCRRFQHALHTCLGGRSSLRGRAARSGAAKGLPRYNDLHYAYVLAGRANVVPLEQASWRKRYHPRIERPLNNFAEGIGKFNCVAGFYSLPGIITRNKDFFALGISLLALATSLVTLWLRRQEVQRTIRNQFVEVMNKISLTDYDLNSIKTGAAYASGDFGALKESDKLRLQLDAMIDQAEYLVQQVPSLATYVDYRALAQAFSRVEDPFKAEFYWEKALETFQKRSTGRWGRWYAKLLRTDSNEVNWYLRLLEGALRLRYAEFLHQKGDYEGCRKQFRRADELFDSDRDQACWQAGWAQILLARIETGLGQEDTAQDCLKAARTRYARMKDEGMRATGLQYVDEYASNRSFMTGTKQSPPAKKLP